MKNKISVLIIYTGGTIGMVNNPETGSYAPFNFSQIAQEVPTLKRFGFQLSTIAFEPPVDSSNLTPEVWVRMSNIIKDNYHQHDGFVVLHGTDTMSYSASALSFMLENNAKPVIFTGSQLPVGTLRTDGRENLISAIEIAAAKKKDGSPQVPEVCIYFENFLYRGNRTSKRNAEHFNAFSSENYPPLAEAGIHIKYNYSAIHYPDHRKILRVHCNLDMNIAILKMYPGISQNVVEGITGISGLKAIILETFGSGNAPSSEWFIKCLEEASQKGIIILNVTQCQAGSVEMGRYETSVKLKSIGVVSGFDTTTEAAVTKLMFLLGQELSRKEIEFYLESNIAGEISIV